MTNSIQKKLQIIIIPDQVAQVNDRIIWKDGNLQRGMEANGAFFQSNQISDSLQPLKGAYVLTLCG